MIGLDIYKVLFVDFLYLFFLLMLEILYFCMEMIGCLLYVNGIC